MVIRNIDDPNIAICHALGLEPMNVTGVNIRLRHGEIPTVTVRRVIWPPAPDADELTTITERYELVERAQPQPHVMRQNPDGSWSDAEPIPLQVGCLGTASHLVRRTLCWLGVHTRACRGRADHHPQRGRWVDW